jgi:DNA-binding LytR/AlgR family response regulator
VIRGKSTKPDIISTNAVKFYTDDILNLYYIWPMILKCILVEDSEIELNLMISFIKRIDFLDLKGTFHNALDAQKYLHKYDVDLIISDIMLPDITGLQMIRTLNKPPQVIFTTSFPDHAVVGFDLDATDYIVKPVIFERFLTAINRAEKKSRLIKAASQEKAPEEDHFFIRSDFSFVKIYYDDILYIESIKDYVRVVTATNSHITSMTMKTIEEQIPIRDFIRIHRSYIVNSNKIEALKNDEVTIGKHVLPVSESYRENLFRTVVGTKIIKR